MGGSGPSPLALFFFKVFPKGPKNHLKVIYHATLYQLWFIQINVDSLMVIFGNESNIRKILEKKNKVHITRGGGGVRSYVD